MEEENDLDGRYVNFGEDDHGLPVIIVDKKDPNQSIQLVYSGWINMKEAEELLQHLPNAVEYAKRHYGLVPPERAKERSASEQSLRRRLEVD